jgi:hypothetical protein
LNSATSPSRSSSNRRRAPRSASSSSLRRWELIEVPANDALPTFAIDTEPQRRGTIDASYPDPTGVKTLLGAALLVVVMAVGLRQVAVMDLGDQEPVLRQRGWEYMLQALDQMERSAPAIHALYVEGAQARIEDHLRSVGQDPRA